MRLSYSLLLLIFTTVNPSSSIGKFLKNIGLLFYIACIYFSLTYSDNCFEEGIDYFLNDFSTIKASNAEKCQTSCQNVAACKFWTFLKSTKQCFLKWKREASKSKNPEDIVSGPKFCKGIFLKLKVCIKRESKFSFFLQSILLT